MMVRIVLVLLGVLLAATAQAQDKPRYGGELIFLVPSEPPSYDGHREGTFGVVHPLAPHYNTLLRIDPFDRTGTRPVPDLAESWTISPDGLVYTLQAAPGREVPRRQRHDLARRQGHLRQDRLPAGRRDLDAQGQLPGGRGHRGARSADGALPAQVARGLLPDRAVLALQLDLQGRHPGQGPALVRDERDGHRPVQVRRARQGLALGRQEEPGLLGQGQALPGRLPRPLHQLVVGPGGRHPRRARAHPVPRLQPGRSRRPRLGAGHQDHRAGEPVGLRAAGDDEPRAQAVRRQARAPRADAGRRPLRGVEEPLPHRGREGGGRHPGAGHAVGHAAGRAGEAGRLRARHRRQPGRGASGCCARPACPTASRSRSRIAACRSRTSRWRSGSSTSGARSG